MRAAIAIVGLVWLFIVYTSLSFWLALVGLGAIGALQIRHANSLRGAPKHTLAWINSLRSRGVAGDAEVAEVDEGAATAENTGTEGSSPAPAVTAAAAPSEPNALQKYARLNIAGIVGALLGVVALLCLLMPWVGIYVEFLGEEELIGYTLTSAGEELEDGTAGALFAILIVLGLLGVASVVVPRLVTAIVAIAGIVVIIFSYVSLDEAFGGAQQSSMGVNAALIPHVGWGLAIICYGLIFLLQLIPPLNRRKT